MRIFGGRKRVLALTAGVAMLSAVSMAQMQPLTPGSVIDAVERLEAGDFLWAPQLAPEGPVLVVVNLATQRLVVYRNGVPIGVSTVSTGRPGHRTPVGVFTILQKRVRHFSSTYNNAPMPYMQRLTWRGIALHGGNLPGYPASHGCIRLPHEFAPLLFGATDLGMTVVITDRDEMPRLGPAPDLLQQAGLPAPAMAGETRWQPEVSPTGPVSIVVSAADRRVIVLRNGIEIGTAPVTIAEPVERVSAYALQSIDASGYHWLRVPLPGDETDLALTADAEEGERFHVSDDFRRAVGTVAVPGTTVVVMPDSLTRGATGTPMTVIEDETAPTG
ncbi:L,D-transpeptidase [Stakelama tenebrarum]|uniref:L,D-transpeptidase n=1 Tax=Stakelama tenebrarum TaxID=2711215 RepID=A0A6G6Y0C2_9SPHN|nr:L,D-transpeptidase [Sphingosinithalassobacter tenebrarum]QIG78394.1 L,D-transpeptidase [Sphingosinithalassobacter tenebrarum]